MARKKTEPKKDRNHHPSITARYQVARILVRLPENDIFSLVDSTEV